MIQTEKGKTLLIEHDVYNYRPYNRLYQLTGTEGFANKYPSAGFTVLEDKLPEGFLAEGEHLNPHGFVPAEVRDKILENYLHPIAVEIEEKAKEVGGHGGMDFIMDYRLIYCLHHGLPLHCLAVIVVCLLTVRVDACWRLVYPSVAHANLPSGRHVPWSFS
jgi:hypothetical protein